MWIFTTRGFYSVVQHQDRPDHVMVRARSKTHLEALGVETPIEMTPDADYLWRTTMHLQTWLRAVEMLNREIDYVNFKSAVAERGGAMNYRSALHDVWETMRRWFRHR